MEKEYYKFIADEAELRWFYDYAVPKIEEANVLFWSLSARNKVLNEEERKTYKLGRSEMIHKTVIRKNGFSFFLESLYGAECNVKGMLTKARVPYPQKSLRLYWNLNSSDVRRVLFEQQRLINEHNSEMIDAALKRSDEAIDSAFHKIRRIFDSTLSLYSRCTGKKMWMDFEVDFDGFCSDLQKNDFIEFARTRLVNLLGRGGFLIVSSPSGFHFPIKRSVVKFPPITIVDIIKNAAEQAKIVTSECIRNENEMICLPSTYTYDSKGNEFIIRVFNKEDFTEKDIIHKTED
jgi:hypothetical protein